MWPPATVIDLRSPAERRLFRHPLATWPACRRSRWAPGGPGPGRRADRRPRPDLRLPAAEPGRRRADRRHRRAWWPPRPGPMLVHCTAGKDRTGIVVAVLLRAIGVRRADVLADYLRTEPNLPPAVERAARRRGARAAEPGAAGRAGRRAGGGARTRSTCRSAGADGRLADRGHGVDPEASCAAAADRRPAQAAGGRPGGLIVSRAARSARRGAPGRPAALAGRPPWPAATQP